MKTSSARIENCRPFWGFRRKPPGRMLTFLAQVPDLSLINAFYRRLTPAPALSPRSAFSHPNIRPLRVPILHAIMSILHSRNPYCTALFCTVPPSQIFSVPLAPGLRPIAAVLTYRRPAFVDFPAQVTATTNSEPLFHSSTLDVRALCSSVGCPAFSFMVCASAQATQRSATRIQRGVYFSLGST
jgi:hypothetical protein